MTERGDTAVAQGPGAAGSASDPRIAELMARAAATELPTARMCRDLAVAHERAGDAAGAVRWALALTDTDADLPAWSAVAGVLRRCVARTAPLGRTAQVAVLGSSTTSQFTALLPLAAARAGVAIETYECGYGQYRQEILDPDSGLYRFDPEVVVLAVHAGDALLPTLADDPDAAVAGEVLRWTSLWDTLRERCGARIIQHAFALPGESTLGHLTLRTAGARATLLARVNAELGRAAGDGVALVDCDRLAAEVGRRSWFDPRYWHRAKQAVSLAHVPLLARHTAAVLGAQLGASRKCLVLDLDNTLWGGVLGEEGLAGIALGDGAVGEAFAAFQEYALALRERGVVLAVCSKNNDADAREAFERHPGMRLRLDDIAMFSASWDDKPTQLRRIAAALGLGLDALVFVDDNPAEREAVRQLVPEVDVIALPADPHGYVRALAAYPFFETTAVTAEDAARTEAYRARAQLAAAEAAASSLEEFHRGLDMTATVVPLDELTLPRVAQLIGKTNQFNLTGRRRGAEEIARLAADPATTVLCVRLADRFADHGLVAVVIAVADGGALAVDTWLMSCRVIGRTLEDEVAGLLMAEARRRGLARVIGEYWPSPKNALVAGLYERLGYQRLDGPDDPSAPDVTRWARAVDEPYRPPGLMRVVSTSAPARPTATVIAQPRPRDRRMEEVPR
ncbi:Subfamily IIIC HAD-superfamily phosphatase [Frankia canadensis]|uniref:Subfamily IIIC HAD-superfamily phosphatase n=1 Tax=Frankia canadensis TaxID=1836972 RepID=A0A2I2L109_9ACTN|nr:HAD-IIIC family phosphatase [Frankia canadensis]SNQ51613.1 Subfamily IIIC HAD-superfamily phosphatase [Frankia canadensis]SOU58903.1 Subfamily IIIC HAD-superfamily phosphatase [Frankia canadensis]